MKKDFNLRCGKLNWAIYVSKPVKSTVTIFQRVIPYRLHGQIMLVCKKYSEIHKLICSVKHKVPVIKALIN